MAEQYSLFSTVYDMFMDNVPYIEWADSIEQTLKKHGINEKIIICRREYWRVKSLPLSGEGGIFARKGRK